MILGPFPRDQVCHTEKKQQHVPARHPRQQQHTPPTSTVGVCAAVCLDVAGRVGSRDPTRHPKQQQHTPPTYTVGVCCCCFARAGRARATLPAQQIVARPPYMEVGCVVVELGPTRYTKQKQHKPHRGVFVAFVLCGGSRGARPATPNELQHAPPTVYVGGVCCCCFGWRVGSRDPARVACDPASGQLPRE